MTLKRIKIFYFYLINRNRYANIWQLLKVFFGKSQKKKALKIIEKIEIEGIYRKIFLKSITNPLYYPVELDLISLEQVIVESFYEDNWHHYQIPETKVHHNDIVLDCGAAEGLFTLMIADKCDMIYILSYLKCL